MDPLASHRSEAHPAVSGDEEAALLARVAAGDIQAFELLYRGYYRRLTRFLERLTRHPNIVDDVLDETMMVVWRKAATFNGTSRASTWIFAIAYNKAMKALRRRGDPMQTLLEDETEGVSEGPETELIKLQSSLGMRRLIARLSPEQRAVVELTYYYGYAYKEIAEIVGCPVDTVKTRMFHARRKLRVMLMALGQKSS
ncbi:MAG: sigma-70 family RNA polymerase sigma factor [Betaproteobacteria bacterium]